MSNELPAMRKLDLDSLSFEERLQLGAENAVRCMGVTASDRVLIITDVERESIAQRVTAAAMARHADVTVYVSWNTMVSVP
jgi:aminopeptidase